MIKGKRTMELRNISTKNEKRSALEIIYENKFIAAIFLFSTLFFLWQHSTGFSWDFSAYILNAKYLAGSGFYYEWARQPLPSLLMLPFSFFGWLLAEYAYIIFVSLLHLFSSLKFAEKFGVDRTLFYVFSMNAYVLVFGQKLGSELLSLAMLQLFMAYIYEKRTGIFAALSFLARYSNLNFLVFIFLQRNAKKIIISFFLALFVISPWLYFNYARTGNPLTSVRDSYLLNIVFRNLDNYVNSFSLFDLLLALNLLLPIMLFGLLSERGEKYHVVLAFLALSVISYFFIPFKEERYLFPITLPAAFFAAKGAENLDKRKIMLVFIIFSLALLFFLLPLARNEPPYLYQSVKSDCMARSNAWVALNYYGVPSEPYPEQKDFAAALEEGYRIILFKGTKFPVYVNNETFLGQFPVMEENDGVVVYGDSGRCKKPARYEMLFFDRIRKKIEEGDVVCDFFSCRYLK
ncbi:MAG: hypothetical protein HYW26_03015 [Candidatus Aenigmarchaeota archaeon]|nr:hypothetical protein [Candidatus Aenigmarchaeota archaeon]